MATTPSFMNGLKQFVDEDSAIGDLARDACADRRVHGFKGKTARGLRSHIRNQHGVHDLNVHATLDSAEQRYLEELGAQNQ